MSGNGIDWIQKMLLVGEGIKFDSKIKIDIKKYLWRPKESLHKVKRLPENFNKHLLSELKASKLQFCTAKVPHLQFKGVT